MSVFLTPTLQPFYAGTYFPPVRRHNLPAFNDLLESLAQAWRQNRGEIEDVARKVVEGLGQMARLADGHAPTEDLLNDAEAALIQGVDRINGGWGRAPKFPQPMTIEYLLRRAAAGRSTTADGLGAAVQTLKAMMRGGMYDVVGGGFSRYSTDELWRVPHFEKMLYDNAQLALAYLHASMLMKDAQFESVCIETLDFMARELMDSEGGFYSSLDADSEGQEGKYYVWTEEQLRQAIADPSLVKTFVAAYGVAARGNWEGVTVLQRALDDASTGSLLKVEPAEIRRQIRECHARLLRARQSRIRPHTDDKVLAAWNGLALQAFAQAARYLGEPEIRARYLSVATRNARFLLQHLRPSGSLRRVWRQGHTGDQVFLEDYAAVILGLLDLYQADFNVDWFAAARLLADEMADRFADPSGGFFDTPEFAEDLLLRPKDIQDSATPSGNALACEALLRLAAFTGEGRYRDIAEQSLQIGLVNAAQYPTASARWLSAADLALAAGKELAILHPPSTGPGEFMRLVDAAYRPNLIVAAAAYPPGPASPEVLRDRPLVRERATAYLCEGFVCRQPVTDPQQLISQF
jgi:hypothetical protein